MELLALLCLIVVLVALAVKLSGGWSAWWREEWRLMCADEWTVGPAPSDLATMEDPRCHALWIRQRLLAARMHRAGASLLAGRSYRPALTKPLPAPKDARFAGKVVPIMRTRRF